MNKFYRDHARQLAEQYDSVPSDTVHACWMHLLPTDPGLAADIGAGSGSDANWLAGQGWDVVAVEPEKAFRDAAMATSLPKVSWLDDSLPRLTRLRQSDTRFNLILVSAVWMHLPPNQRQVAFRVLSELLAPGGLLVISLRHEPDAKVREQRGFYEVTADELSVFAKDRALDVLARHASQDSLGRENVTWETLCFRLPDDGTGSLPLLRHIIVNDNKAASYKLGLLRTLIRIAEGAPGLVLRRTDDWVEIPFGAVGLYWIKLYAPAILEFELPQHPNSKVGYGFAGKDFNALKHESRFDIRLGGRVAGDLAKTITGALKAVCSNIAKMPAHYTTYPGSLEPIFQVDKASPRRSSSLIEINRDFLSQFGTFRIPAAIWLTMGQYACWLEPAIVNEWVRLMQSWDEARGGKSRDLQDYYKGIEWRHSKRDTALARARFTQLSSGGVAIPCSWSNRRLTAENCVIDHCFPWSRWFNNDLWNLVPATEIVNGRKSDKLPSARLLMRSKDRVINWWEMAYAEEGLARQFFVEAQSALPLLDDEEVNHVAVFSSLLLQQKKLRANQQLAEWNG